MSASARRVAVDLETTRLIFVMLKGAKPMRKVAIPITETTTWSVFQSQVMAKLRIQGIQSMNMAATGEVVTALSQLQDIDQVHVQEAAESQAVMSSSGVAMQYIAPRQSSAIDPRNLVNGSGEAILPESHAATNEASSSQKDAELGRRGRKKTRITTLQGLTAAILTIFFIFVLFRYVLAFGASSAPVHPVPKLESDGVAGIHAPTLKGNGR